VRRNIADHKVQKKSVPFFVSHNIFSLLNDVCSIFVIEISKLNANFFLYQNCYKICSQIYWFLFVALGLLLLFFFLGMIWHLMT